MQQFSGSRLLLLAVIVPSLLGASFAQVAITVSFGPPALPVYVQPVCPAPGYLWVPGYWAYDPNFGDYYWVPGTWVLARRSGCSGLRHGGVGGTACIFSMRATGDLRSVSTAGLFMDSATSGTATTEDAGTMASFSTTAR